MKQVGRLLRRCSAVQARTLCQQGLLGLSGITRILLTYAMGMPLLLVYAMNSRNSENGIKTDEQLTDRRATVFR